MFPSAGLRQVQGTEGLSLCTGNAHNSEHSLFWETFYFVIKGKERVSQRKKLAALKKKFNPQTTREIERKIKLF